MLEEEKLKIEEEKKMKAEAATELKEYIAAQSMLDEEKIQIKDE